MDKGNNQTLKPEGRNLEQQRDKASGGLDQIDRIDLLKGVQSKDQKKKPENINSNLELTNPYHTNESIKEKAPHNESKQKGDKDTKTSGESQNSGEKQNKEVNSNKKASPQ